MPFDQPHAPYDRKGKCKHHPQIRLRKRGTLGIGWTTLRLRCPLCFFGATTLPAVDAAKTKKTAACGNVIPKSRTQDLEHSDAYTSTSPTVSSSSQSLSSTSDHGTTATTLVAAAYPEEESSSVECGMPYSYTYHNITYPGFYTGQIRGGRPHGVGTWRGRHNASIIVKGEWFHGFHLKSASSWNEGGFGIIVGQPNTRSNHKACQKLVRQLQEEDCEYTLDKSMI